MAFQTSSHLLFYYTERHCSVVEGQMDTNTIDSFVIGTSTSGYFLAMEL